jgi:hypothetical protein
MYRISVLLLTACLLTGCSNRFIYKQLDWLIPWYVDDYVDLTLVQKDNLEEQVDKLLRWHRGEELSRYIGILGSIEQDLSRPITNETVQKWFDDVLVSAKRVQTNILPPAIKLGEGLSDEQVREFVQNLWERQTELEEEYLSRSNEEYIEEVYEDLSDNLIKYVGRLTPEQKNVLNEAAGLMQRFDHVWLDDRRNWLGKIEKLLERKPGWQQAMLEAFASREGQQPKRFKQYLAYNTNIINQAIADVMNNLNKKQQEKLNFEIADLRDDFEVIIATAQ